MRTLGLLLIAVALAGCGGASKPKAAPPAHLKPPPLTSARARTVAAGTAHFSQTTSVTLGTGKVTAYSSGNASFATRRGHLYRIVPGSTVASEVIVAGPIVYSNGNTEAALTTPGLRAWTKLDTRALTPKQLAAHPDDLGFAIAPAFLADAARTPVLRGTTATRARYTARVDPAQLGRALPKAQRAFVLQALHADFPAKAFTATFWLDARGRVRRVLVDYTTAQGTPISIDTRYTAFGVGIDVTPPAATQDITPR